MIDCMKNTNLYYFTSMEMTIILYFWQCQASKADSFQLFPLCAKDEGIWIE